MTFKTMQEQEREAYITGHTSMASALADADDAEIRCEDREAEMQAEIDDLNVRMECVDATLSTIQSDIQELEYLNAGLQCEVDELTKALNFERTR